LGVVQQQLARVGLELLLGGEVVRHDMTDGGSQRFLVAANLHALARGEPFHDGVGHALRDLVTSSHSSQDYTRARRSVKEARAESASFACRAAPRSEREC